MSLREIKGALASHRRFKNRCYVCRKSFGKGFAFHHLWYYKESGCDAVYSDFKGNSLKYNIALMPFVKAEPKRFLLFCLTHHHAVERGVAFNPDKYDRIVKAVRMTKDRGGMRGGRRKARK